MKAVTCSVYDQYKKSSNPAVSPQCDLSNSSSIFGSDRNTIIDSICSGISPESDDYNENNGSDEYQINFTTSHGDLNRENGLETLSNGGEYICNRGDGLQDYQNNMFTNATKHQVLDNR